MQTAKQRNTTPTSTGGAKAKVAEQKFGKFMRLILMDRLLFAVVAVSKLGYIAHIHHSGCVSLLSNIKLCRVVYR